ncbi:MAG: PH domain-containing protein, partial [Legionellales bacterium]
MRTDLRYDEKVILQVEKHWVVLVKPALILLACLLWLYFMPKADTPFLKSMHSIIVCALCLSASYFWYCFQARKANIWVVTNSRVIDEEGVVSWSVKESPIDKINNIELDETFFGRRLGYGSVEIQ